jgi:nucleoside-diphosphate-sugar epimerase
MKKAVVTGAAGFIGGHLCLHLKKRGYWVRAVDYTFPQYIQARTDEMFWNCDLRYQQEAIRAVDGMDEVYALAADMGGMGYISSNHFEILKNNALININTAVASKYGPAKKVFYTSSACFVPGTLVTTDCGVASIEDIQIGNKVLTHEGKFRIVEKVFAREHQGSLVEIELPGLPKIYCTPDHRFMTKSDEWKRADELSRSDYLIVPVTRECSYAKNRIPLDLPRINVQYLEFLQKAPKNLSEYARTSGIGYGTLWRWRKVGRLPKNLDPVLEESVLINESLGELTGIFLAEGWIENGSGKPGARRRVTFGFGDEPELIDRTTELLNKVFGIPRRKVRRVKMRGQKGLKLQIVSEVLAGFFELFCYSGAKQKRAWSKALHSDLMDLSNEFTSGLLKGYWAGDGCIHETETRMRMSVYSVSNQLIWQIRILLLRLGIFTSLRTREASISDIEGRSVECKEGYSLYVVGKDSVSNASWLFTGKGRQNRYGVHVRSGRRGDADVFLIRPKSISVIDYFGPVHNLEVKSDNSYTVYGVATHNCVYPEAMQMDEFAEIGESGLNEADAWCGKPDTAYGIEKLFSEELYGHLSKVSIARFHNIFGPQGSWNDGREKAPAALCRKIAVAKLSGNPEVEIWGDGEQTRSFCHIDDCLEMIVRLMESDYKGPMNIGTDRLVSINELADIIAGIARVDIVKKHDLSKPQGVRGRNADLTQMRRVLNYEASVSLEAGLSHTYVWIEEMVRTRRDLWDKTG